MIQPKGYDCIIIGGGAAGLMCAAQAAKRGRRVIVLERAKRLGRKILMSGGGRCNFTNRRVELEHFISSNNHFAISALRRYTNEDFIQLVDQYELKYHEKTLGQLFCDNRSKDILDILVNECQQQDVQIQTQCLVETINQTDSGHFELLTNTGVLTGESLVIATGGLSIPSMGATGFGYDVARQFGLEVLECQPSLVPLTLPKRLIPRAQAMAGVSLTAKVSCNNHKQVFTDQLLFTHSGFSGPAILQISNYWDYGQSVTIDFLPHERLEVLIDQWRQSHERAILKNLLSRVLPKRFVIQWLLADSSVSHLQDQPLDHLSREALAALEQLLHQFTFIPSGTEGYQVAEVTRGGVDTNEISSKTFEAKKVKGLYFIGEVLDVTGWLGGYNFQWAWSSGYCAGQVI